MVHASLGLAASFIILSIVPNLCKELCCMLQKQHHVPAYKSSQRFLSFYREQRAACAMMTATSASQSGLRSIALAVLPERSC